MSSMSGAQSHEAATERIRCGAALDTTPDDRFSSAAPSVSHERAAFGLPPGLVPAARRSEAAVARCVVFEADDLGLLFAFNEGIRAARRDGLLTSTCLRANGYAYEHAVREVLPSCPGLGVGVHLCLNEAEPVSDAALVPDLVDGHGALRRGFGWLIGASQTPSGLRQIECELRAQIEKVLADGIAIDHLNSHQHVHMIPAIFRVTCRLAREYAVPCVRLTRELPYGAGGMRKRVQPLLTANILKHLLLNRYARLNELAARRYAVHTTDYFVGVNYTAHMNLAALLQGLCALPFGSVEVLLHPALGPDPRDTRYPTAALRRYTLARQRRTELRALRSSKLTAFIRQERWATMTFGEWSQNHQLRPLRTSTPEIPAHVRDLCTSVELHCPPWVSEAQDDSRVFAQLVASRLRPGQHALDLGTGTGIIAVCLARLGHRVTAADISAAAVRTAQANAERNGVRFECLQSDLLSSATGPFDLIAFNLPYGFGPDNWFTSCAKHVLRRVPWVRRNSGLAMPRPVLRFHQQLTERLLQQAPSKLAPGGEILLHTYEAEVASLARVLPAGAEFELLQHRDLTRNRTVGMLICLQPHPGAAARVEPSA